MYADEHKISLESLYERLVSSSGGLSGSEVRKRQKQSGLNILEQKKEASAIVKFSKHLVNFFAILLWLGSILSFVAEYLSPGQGNLYIGFALAGVVILNAVFTFIQEYQTERIMESFRNMMPIKIEALRDGERKEIFAARLVPGDIIYLKEGDKVPADGRLIEESALKVDNSSLTGESEPQLRTLQCTHENILESRNMVFSGTLVQSGNGTAVVFGTGMNTQIGRIAQLTKQTVSALSPLRKELDHFIKVISIIAISLGITFFSISLIKGDRLMASLIFAIGIIVANVPEGLLPTVTLCLSMASKKMAKRRALLKNLDSVETLGSTTVICTDKTGTITENRMSVNTLFINMRDRHIDEKGIGEIPGFDDMIRLSVLCNNARLDEKGGIHGDPTEGALLKFANDFVDIRQVNLDNKRLHEAPFDSKEKRMITLNRAGDAVTAYLKGAPEVVLEKCSRLRINSNVYQLQQLHKEEIKEHYERLASRGQRILGLGYRDGDNALEEGFIFIGLVGMIDPPRREIPEAISRCRTAGIRVIMITGDYSVTAEAIAKKAGMLTRGRANVMTGEELDNADDEQLKIFLQRDNIIFARTSPLNKLRIVRTLQSMGEVVTVTGDGVNDAPALKNADMGVAMGIIGTEVAKEASDMVLLDDNFATIVNAIEEGRTVFNNIKKFIAYILTSNIPEIMPFIAFVLLGIPLPLTIILILCIDLGTDLLPALGLGVEAPETDVMKMPPRSRFEHLLAPNLLFMAYGVYGMIQMAAGFFSYFVVLHRGGWAWGEQLAVTSPLYLKAVTAFFASIIFCQIANVMVCRTRRESVLEKGFFSNRLVLMGILSELLFLGIIVYNPLTHALFGTQPLSVFELSLSVPFAIFTFFGDELRKRLIRRGNMFVVRYLSW